MTIKVIWDMICVLLTEYACWRLGSWGIYVN